MRIEYMEQIANENGFSTIKTPHLDVGSGLNMHHFSQFEYFLFIEILYEPCDDFNHQKGE